MRPSDRQSKITDIIRHEGRVTVEGLVTRFGSSPETVRRDLSVLARAGKLQKIHGGAVLPGGRGEGSFNERMSQNVAQKRAIAKKACSLVSPGDILFIDTGSTTLMFAEELDSCKDLTVITNSTEIAKVIGSQPSKRVFLVGGEFDSDNCETRGPIAISQLKKYRANHAVLAIGGISANAGIMDFHIDEAYVAIAMIEQTENVIVLADSSKLGRIAPFEVVAFEHIDDFVCDVHPTGQLKEALDRGKVTSHCSSITLC